MVRLRSLKRKLGSSNVLEDEFLIKEVVQKVCSFSQDLDETYLPKVLVKPTKTDDIITIIKEANREREKVLVIGSASRPYCADLKYVSLILDTTNLDNLISINTAKGYALVSAGLGILDLKSLLTKLGLKLRVDYPYNSTIGALATSLVFNSKSFRFGSFVKQIKEVDFIDGLGRQHLFKSEDKISILERSEGSIGVVNRVLLKLDKNKYTYSAYFFNSVEEAFEKSFEFLDNKQVYSLTILNKTLSNLLGFEGENYCLLVGKVTLNPTSKDEFLDNKEVHLHEKLTHLGVTHFEDFQFSNEDSLFEFVKFLEERDLSYYIYPASFVVRFYIGKEKELFFEVLKRAHSLGADVGLRGFGALKRNFVPLSLKRRILKLKEDYNYNNTLNPGKIIALK